MKESLQEILFTLLFSLSLSLPPLFLSFSHPFSLCIVSCLSLLLSFLSLLRELCTLIPPSSLSLFLSHTHPPALYSLPTIPSSLCFSLFSLFLRLQLLTKVSSWISPTSLPQLIPSVVFLPRMPHSSSLPTGPFCVSFCVFSSAWKAPWTCLHKYLTALNIVSQDAVNVDLEDADLDVTLFFCIRDIQVFHDDVKACLALVVVT